MITHIVCTKCDISEKISSALIDSFLQIHGTHHPYVYVCPSYLLPKKCHKKYPDDIIWNEGTGVLQEGNFYRFFTRQIIDGEIIVLEINNGVGGENV